MKTIVHVNHGNIRQNIKRDPNDRLPVLRAQGDFDTLYGDHIDICLLYTSPSPRDRG